MQFYNRQPSYSYKDINHIKQLITWISRADKYRCEGWSSPASYIYDSKMIEYCIDKRSNMCHDVYLFIAYRLLTSQNKRLSLDDMVEGEIDRWYYEWRKLKNPYIIKLGFYRVIAWY